MPPAPSSLTSPYSSISPLSLASFSTYFIGFGLSSGWSSASSTPITPHSIVSLVILQSFLFLFLFYVNCNREIMCIRDNIFIIQFQYHFDVRIGLGNSSSTFTVVHRVYISVFLPTLFAYFLLFFTISFSTMIVTRYISKCYIFRI